MNIFQRNDAIIENNHPNYISYIGFIPKILIYYEQLYNLILKI